MSEALFDLSDEYDAMLHRGIRLSGEDRDFFVAGRIQDLKSQLLKAPKRILDFGCGIGNTTSYFAQSFPQAEIVGIDTSENALEHARKQYGSARTRFQTVDHFNEFGSFDLCYVNGVFHHIEPEDRPSALQVIHRALRHGGRLALFENNPWNPGTRMVMSRIPFDRDAKTLSPGATKRLLVQVGFQNPTVRSLFYFPRFMAWLRPMEPHLASLPFGAQYYVLANKS